MGDNTLSIEDKLEFERFKEKYKHIFENEAITAIANWEDPIHKLGGPRTEEFSEEKYLARAKKAIKGLGDYFKTVLDRI
jgi:hypothetical protein